MPDQQFHDEMRHEHVEAREEERSDRALRMESFTRSDRTINVRSNSGEIVRIQLTGHDHTAWYGQVLERGHHRYGQLVWMKRDWTAVA